MLVAEYNNGQISSYTIDSNENPVLASRHAFVTGLTGAEGSVIDPVTGDLLFSTFGGSSQVIEVRGFAIPTATSFTFSGPTGGALNTASSNFTVTPNAAYTGTISITPSGGGLSAAIVLTFSNSSVAQTFTLTPTAVGPVTLTPSNSGSLTNPSTLSYATPPSAPTIGTATAGNGSASVAFTAPAGAGGSAITLYTATCISGNITGTAASSPITVTGLANGTAYTCSVTATNAAGTSAASSASNPVTPGGVPGAPQGVLAVSGSGQASISFSAPSNGGAPITHYTVIATPGGSSANGSTSPVTITGLNNGTVYTFSVAASNRNGTGPAAISNSVIPVGLPGAPVG